MNIAVVGRRFLLSPKNPYSSPNRFRAIVVVAVVVLVPGEDSPANANSGDVSCVLTRTRGISKKDYSLQAKARILPQKPNSTSGIPSLLGAINRDLSLGHHRSLYRSSLSRSISY